MTDEDKWRQRLLAYTAVRAAGVAVFLLGVAIAFSGLVRPGGWPQVGAIVAICGALEALLAPRLVKQSWDRRDREQK
ncbi:MAG: hypothetical protein ABIW33_07405 [Sphingomicrobium sp.]